MKFKTVFYLATRFLLCRFFGKRYPLAIAFELTHKCNLRCPHCYNTDLEKKLDREDHLKLLDEMYDAGCRIVSFTGGEPLLIKYLPELMIRAKELGMWVQYTTNGTFLKKREEEIKAANPDMIQISIDGNKETHEYSRGKGSFDEVMTSLETVKRNNWRCLLVSVLHDQTTIESLTFVLVKALDIGAFVSFQPVCDYPETEPSEGQLSRFLDFLKEVRKSGNLKKFIGVLEKYGTANLYTKVFTSKRKFYNPMDQSMVVLNHLYRNADYVPCTGGRLFGRIMPDGQLISCYAAIDMKHPINVLRDGFQKAWQSIKIHKGKELHHHRLELNLIYALSLPTLINVLYYHLNKKYYKLNGQCRLNVSWRFMLF
jgi:MoaA/NifB/PqqE/SkfB family radical SAM enzyme